MARAPLSTRHVLREMARAYRERWAFLLGAGLLFFIPVSLLEALDSEVGDVDTDELDAVTAVELSVLVAAESITTLLATVLYAGAVAAAVAARREGRRTSLRQLVRTLPYGRLIAADLLLTLVVLTGLVVLVVPGIVLLTWFSLVGPAIELEHRGVIDAFRRSRALVRAHPWRVAVLVVPAFFAEDLLGSAASSASASALGESFVSEWLGGLVGNLAAAPVFALAAVVLFYELRERARHRPAGRSPSARGGYGR